MNQAVGLVQFDLWLKLNDLGTSLLAKMCYKFKREIYLKQLKYSILYATKAHMWNIKVKHIQYLIPAEFEKKYCLFLSPHL